ncbi:MAG: hypothetical protein ACSHXZ_05790 [Gammaproteobacteria bacterium]
MQTFEKVVLFTDADGYAQFRTEDIPLTEGSPEVRLSREFAAQELQLRESPIGFRSAMHCTTSPQWLFVLSGAMEIGLADGSTRLFKAGEHFYSADRLPQGAVFDPKVHGHWSRQVGDVPLVTLFVKD